MRALQLSGWSLIAVLTGNVFPFPELRQAGNEHNLPFVTIKTRNRLTNKSREKREREREKEAERDTGRRGEKNELNVLVTQETC